MNTIDPQRTRVSIPLSVLVSLIVVIGGGTASGVWALASAFHGIKGELSAIRQQLPQTVTVYDLDLYSDRLQGALRAAGVNVTTPDVREVVKSRPE